MARFAFREVVRVLASTATRNLGVADAKGVVLGVAEDEGTGAWYSVLVAGVTYSIFEGDLETCGRVVSPEAIWTGKSLRADAEGNIIFSHDESKPPVTATTVWELPCRSQDFREGPLIRQGPDSLVLAYDFETETGDYSWEEMTFTGVAAFSFTAALHCTEDQVAAYDKVQRIAPSRWAKELSEVSADAVHYRIYFDDAGCYEVLATGFMPPSGPLDGKAVEKYP